MSWSEIPGRLLALPRTTTYPTTVVKQPLVNIEETIDRLAGRRTPAPDALQAGMQIQAAGLEFHRAFKHRWLAGGVHRFKTHEEADAWMIKMLARSGMAET